MKFLEDEGGQGAAEYVLLFGGVIVFAIAALLIYRGYITTNGGLSSDADLAKVRGSIPS